MTWSIPEWPEWIALISVLFGFSSLLWLVRAQGKAINRQYRREDSLRKTLAEAHAAILNRDLASMALQASKETNSMVGPAVLQQLREPVEPPKVEEKKKTGVRITQKVGV